MGPTTSYLPSAGSDAIAPASWDAGVALGVEPWAAYADLIENNARLVSVKPPSPAVVISPSQLSLYDRCRRHWAWKYIAGIREPPTPSQLLGVRTHAVFEAWLRDGRVPDRRTLEGRIALKGLEHLPPPGAGQVEKNFYMTTRRGYHYMGIADWTGWHPTLGGMVIDHKTTSNLKWAKTPEELEYDVQALLYAMFACISLQVSHVTLRWNYVQTNAKKAQIVQVSLGLPQVIERFPIIEERAAEMTAHRKNRTHPLRMMPNALACGDFGGCPHQDRCMLSPAEKMEAIMANEQAGTMRDHMTALTNYRPPNGDGSFPPMQPPPGIPQPGAQQNPAPITAYLPQGPTQLHTPPSGPPQTASGRQPVTDASAGTQARPFYQDPTSGFLVDAQTRNYLPREHPAYQYPDAYRQYQVAPPPPQHPAVQEPQAQPPQAQPPQAQPPQYPAYPPNAGPNAPEQHENPAQIPPAIATPQGNVPGAEAPKKRRGRRTKAEMEAARAATGEAPSSAQDETVTGEQLAFIHAVSGVLASSTQFPTLEQLVYVGSMARDAFNKAFEG